jgi:hypothetical protein
VRRLRPHHGLHRRPRRRRVRPTRLRGPAIDHPVRRPQPHRGRHHRLGQRPPRRPQPALLHQQLADGAGQVSGSEGGWTLSVKLEVVPGPAPRNVLAAIPLYNADYGADTPDPEIPFSLPEGTTKASLSYTVSGHGGGAAIGDCIGPAEEFCKRTHHILLDGAEFIDFIPWRGDCTTFCTVTDNPSPKGPAKYCAENPCGAMASVNAPRANWCPSAVVEAFTGPILLGPGAHSFGFRVDGVVPGGSWTTSAIVYAYGD